MSNKLFALIVIGLITGIMIFLHGFYKAIPVYECSQTRLAFVEGHWAKNMGTKQQTRYWVNSYWTTECGVWTRTN